MGGSQRGWLQEKKQYHASPKSILKGSILPPLKPCCQHPHLHKHSHPSFQLLLPDSHPSDLTHLPA